MKQLQAKLSAGILTAVMILGMVFTMAPMKADAAAYQDVLNVLAVDENGTPLADVELVFEKDGMTYDFDTTDANGKISGYSMVDDAEIGLNGIFGEYVIKPAANSEYTVVGNPCIVDIEKAPEAWGFPYIASVYGKPYAGETVQLTLKSASSEKPEITVTEVTGAGAEVARAGGTAAIHVKGTNLPDKFYYVMNLYDEKGRLLAQCGEKEATAAGTETERTFDATFPSVEDEKYQDAAYWEVGVETVSNPEDGYYTTKKDKNQQIQIAKKSETVDPTPGENPGGGTTGGTDEVAPSDKPSDGGSTTTKPQNPVNPGDNDSSDTGNHKSEYSKQSTVQTGDESHTILWATVMLAALAGVSAITLRRRQKKQN